MRRWRSFLGSPGVFVPLGLTAIVAFTVVAAWVVVVHMPGTSFHGTPPTLTGEEMASRIRLERHVRVLAGDIGERNYRRPEALDSAARYIDAELSALGYEVVSHEFEVRGRTYVNLEAVLDGAARPGEIVVVGAHYDTAPGTPGADDNASGVAALLELARLLREGRFDRTVRLVAFANEEPPFFDTPDMGSRFYAGDARERGDSIVAMLSLESIGYFSTVPESQRYPAPFDLLYPETGDFVAFVGDLASRELVHRSIAAFRAGASLPSEGIAAPSRIPGVWWSDHDSFWREGYPALMLTDTAPFRSPHYHAPTDTPERLNYDARSTIAALHGRCPCPGDVIPRACRWRRLLFMSSSRSARSARVSGSAFWVVWLAQGSARLDPDTRAAVGGAPAG